MHYLQYILFSIDQQSASRHVHPLYLPVILLSPPRGKNNHWTARHTRQYGRILADFILIAPTVNFAQL